MLTLIKKCCNKSTTDATAAQVKTTNFRNKSVGY